MQATRIKALFFTELLQRTKKHKTLWSIENMMNKISKPDIIDKNHTF